MQGRLVDWVDALPRPVRYDRLPYRGFVEPKHGRLGRRDSLAGLVPPARDRIRERERIAAEARCDRPG